MLSGLPALQQQRLRAELRPGEQLLWAGQPSADAFFRYGFAAWLIGLPFLALCLYPVLQLFRRAIDVFDVLTLLFCAVMIAIVLAILHMPWRMRRNARYTVYAVTGERAFKLEGVRVVVARSFARSRGPDFKCVERRDGSGDLVFELDTSVDSDGIDRTSEAGFFSIAGVARVAALVNAPPAP